MGFASTAVDGLEVAQPHLPSTIRIHQRLGETGRVERNYGIADSSVKHEVG